jgi:hypothetical protein
MDHYVTAATSNAKGSIVLIGCRCGDIFVPLKDVPIELRWPPAQYDEHILLMTEED